METLKGLARRTTQSLREMVSRIEVTPEEVRLAEVMAKVKTMEARGELICQKVIQAARLMEELGVTLREIGEEYRGVPDLPRESRDLADDVFEVGIKLVETSQEHQKGLKDNGFELLRSFSKQCAQLREVEETRRHHQLEYDFFKAKVQDLRSSTQKDCTRLPRNERILENWRVELWRVTERSKSMCSRLYVDGRCAIDRSVLTTVQVLHSFVEIASTGFAQTFEGVRLPTYPTTPVLPPSALPPAPLPNGTSLPPPAAPSSYDVPASSILHAGTASDTITAASSSSTRRGSALPPGFTAGSTHASMPPAWSMSSPPVTGDATATTAAAASITGAPTSDAPPYTATQTARDHCTAVYQPPPPFASVNGTEQSYATYQPPRVS